MNLQKKTLSIFVILLALVLVVISIFFSTILLASYSDLEVQYIEKDLNQAVNKLNDEFSTLSSIVSDWAPWDDTYNFVNGNDPEYITSNLLVPGFDNLNLNLIVMTNNKGEVVFSGAYDLVNKVVVPAPPFFVGPLDLNSPLMNMSNPHSIMAGILMLPEDPMILVSQPIVRSDFSGQPQGVVIMGRYLDKAEISRLSILTQPSLAFIRTDDPALSPDLVASIRETRRSKPGIIRQLNGEEIAGYVLIKDIYGNDTLVLRITEARDIYHQGLDTTVQVLLIILFSGAFLGLVVIILLDRVLLKRMSSLATQVYMIGKSGSIKGHVAVEGDDELSGLAIEINRMLDTIEKFQKELGASEARFRELSDLLPQIIFELDTNANLTYVNKFGRELFGVSEKDLETGLHARQFLIPEDLERIYRNLKMVAAGEKSRGEIYTMVKKDRSTLRAILLSSPIIHDGRVEGFRGSGIDISERLNLEEALAESEEYLRLLLSSIQVGILVIDTDTHTIIDANPAASSLIGTDRDALIGRECHRSVCPAESGRCPITDLHQRVDNAESTLINSDGQSLSIIKYIVPIILNGKPCLLETFIDNTYRKQIELKLAESEEKYRALAENSADIIFSLDKSGIFSYISPQVSRYGFDPTEVIGKGFLNFIHPDYHTTVLNNYQQEMLDGASISSTFRILDKKGNVHWIEENSNIKRDFSGNPVGMVGILRDVTDRVRAEDALRLNRERLENILRASPVVVFETDPAGNLLFASELWESLIGYPFDEMKGRHWAEVIYPEDRDRLADGVVIPIRELGIKGAEARIIRPEGSVLWVFGQSVAIYSPDGIIRGHVGTITDITGRKLAEEEIARTLSILESTMESTADGILVADGKGGIVLFNEKFKEMWGIPEAIIVSKDDDAAIRFVLDKLKKPEIFLKTVRDLYKAPEKISFDILELVDGRVFERYSQPQRIGNFVSGRVWSFRDITERKRTEDALVESEQKYRALTENTGDILFSIDMAGFFTYISPQVNKYGFLEDELIGRSIRDFIHPEDVDRVEHDLTRDLEVGAQFHSTFRILDKWGNVHWFDEKGTLRLDQYGRPIGIYGVLRDDSERRRSEDAIELANKKLNLMNNITRHDILNTITGLLGCVDMANATSSPEEKLQLLNDIRDLTRIIQRQIAFTKEYQEVGVNLPMWQNVSVVIKKVLQNFDKSGIIFTIDLEHTEIYADPLLEKVFYNLIDNALRYGEKITTIKIYTQTSGNSTLLIFEDDGMGIPDDQKTLIFERGVGRNTGMGLFLTQEILAITGITIKENGIPMSGARFEMHVPWGTFRSGSDMQPQG
jgi:PAS domain S-box-containing protein